MTRIQKIFKKQGFTLVELIIVIAIIAVLAIAAFMMLTKWLGKSRDSRRLSDLGTIARGLTVGYSDTDDGINMYPTVENQLGSIELLSGAETVGYQGLVDDDVATAASMQKAPKDPSDESYYTYLVSQNRQKFQLLAFLEDGSEVSVLNNAYALEYEKMTPTTKGFDLGIVLRASDNMPANLIGGTLTGIDLASATEYKAVVKDDDIRFGTGVATAPIVKEEIVDVSEPQEEINNTPEEPELPSYAYPEETVLLIHGETGISDTSGKNNTINVVGNTYVDTNVSKVGNGSIYFDGIGDYLELSPDIDYTLGTDDFTIDFWVRLDSDLSVSGGGPSRYRGIVGYRNESFVFYVDDNNGSVSGSAGTDIRLAWHHIAIVRSNGITKHYVDGIEEYSFDDTGDIIGDTATIRIFDGADPYARFVPGYLDEFRIVKGVAVWTEDFSDELPVNGY